MNIINTIESHTRRLSLLGLLVLSLTTGCAANLKDTVAVQPSYLQSPKINAQELLEGSRGADGSDEGEGGQLVRLPPASKLRSDVSGSQDLLNTFSDNSFVELAMNDMPLKDFLHYTFGELLAVNYVLDDNAKNDVSTVTLNLQDRVSKRRLFRIVEEVLTQKNYLINLTDGLFYIVKNTEKNAKGEVVYGFGNRTKDVPQTSREIFQIVPLDYGMRGNYNLILSKLTNAMLIPDFDQGLYYIKGKREDVVKAIEFLDMVDAPYYQGQHIGLATFTYIPPETFIEQATVLLENEGISVGTGGAKGKSVVFVPLSHLGAVAIFASSEELLSRIEFWTAQLDKPVQGGEEQYFVFQPRFARATDLMESLSPLIGGSSQVLARPQISSMQEGQGNVAERSEPAIVKAEGDGMRLVVDERSNAIIVFASGKKYQQLLPLMKRMDIMPKQVILEVVIAEVTLRDQFKQGVEFFLNNNNYTVGTEGALGLGDIGGLTYVLTGSSRWDVTAKLEQSNSLVNVLSRPSLVVRDGVTASMEVGTDIPIVSSTSSPDVGVTTSVQYRKTGLTLDVTPTVNSQGVVIMEISQNISSVLDDGITAQGAPSIFDRSMQTEVVADSGQTVILGGLISENVSKGNSKVPGLGDLPLLGQLFSSKSDVTDKTELIIMVTPRIIHNQEEWLSIRAQFDQGLSQLKLSD
ncbi:secretin N-terminal domain-containing protein [Bowmanella dokdonensis]|uniref:General secretion pathway protein D n=1 Tax=Bowmanella dokdonensis TaxID=751969 RepID=A0A939DT97_9ALTE|nr:secretin N-terminal domain-containing protein [Bowmanella dokdonensis]MBN7827526.1 hypothetical protein [Bowmanella dokdonensis]